jgi:hypothetical protein
MNQAAEPVLAQNPDVSAQSVDADARRAALLQCPVRPVRIVVIDILTEDQPQVPFAGDQHPVQALPAAPAVHGPGETS